MNASDTLDEKVWLAAVNAYEAPHTIAADLARDLGRSVSESEVLSSFVRLARAGRVEAFQLSPSQPHAVRVPVAEIATIAEPWFLAAEVEHGLGSLDI